MKHYRQIGKFAVFWFLIVYLIRLEVPIFLKTFLIRGGGGAMAFALFQFLFMWSTRNDLQFATSEMIRVFHIWIVLFFIFFVLILYVPRLLSKVLDLTRLIKTGKNTWHDILKKGPRELHKEWDGK